MSGNYIGREPAPDGLILVGDTNPIGMVGYFHGVPDGSWLVLNGQAVFKAAYPDLWAYAQGFLTSDQVANPGLYKDLNPTGFVLPNLSGLFIRAAGQVDAQHVAAALGVQQADMVGPHTHTIAAQTQADAGQPGAGRYAGVTQNTVGGALVNSGTETRPVNVALVPCVKALRTTLMPATFVPQPSITLEPSKPMAGTAIEFLNVPSWAKRVTLMFAAMQINGVGRIIAQLGSASGFDTTALTYFGSAAQISGAAVGGSALFSTGFDLTGGDVAAVTTLNGRIVFELLTAAPVRWVAASNVGYNNGAAAAFGGGYHLVPGTLDRVRLTTIAGSAAFTGGGLASISYE
jgi:hypothetical protein